MITISDKAKKELLLLRVKEGHPHNYNLRVSVKGGGCSGLMYDLNFDSTLTESDEVYESNELKIIIDKKSVLYLTGTTLDFSSGLNGKGFQFINPNATRTCGCGESFSL